MESVVIDPLNERVRRFLLQRLSGSVRKPSNGWLGWISKHFFTATAGTYAFAYTDCDPERANCTGEVRTAWQIDSEGTRQVEVTPEAVPLELRGMWYRFHQFHFYVAPYGDWIILASMAGPRAGYGGRFVVIPQGESFLLRAEGVHWRA